MNVSMLQDIGLTKLQAETYLTLVKAGIATAPEIAKSTDGSRTNTYKTLDKLCELGLASKDTSGTKVTYSSVSPAALEQFVERQVAGAQMRQRKLHAAMPDLLTFYFEHSERPSIRYFHGREGLEQIYKDQVITGKPIRYIRTLDDLRYIGFEDLHHLRNLFPRLGIKRRAIIQDVAPEIPEGMQTMPIAESDKAMLLERTWIDKDDYDAPVEWAVYGNKLSIVSYGQEAIGMIIESQQIADAFSQLFGLLEQGIRNRPGYDQYPLHATYTAKPKAVRS